MAQALQTIDEYAALTSKDIGWEWKTSETNEASGTNEASETNEKSIQTSEQDRFLLHVSINSNGLSAYRDAVFLASQSTSKANILAGLEQKHLGFNATNVRNVKIETSPGTYTRLSDSDTLGHIFVQLDGSGERHAYAIVKEKSSAGGCCVVS